MCNYYRCEREGGAREGVDGELREEASSLNGDDEGMVAAVPGERPSVAAAWPADDSEPTERRMAASEGDAELRLALREWKPEGEARTVGGVCDELPAIMSAA